MNFLSFSDKILHSEIWQLAGADAVEISSIFKFHNIVRYTFKVG